MQYKDHANKDDIESDVKYLITGSATGDIDYSDDDLLRNVNRWYDDTTSVIMLADDGWQYDDNNYDNLPIAYTDLEAGQPDYEVTALTFMNLMEVLVRDKAGNYRQMTGIDRRKTSQSTIDRFNNNNSGLPEQYDLLGNSIMLGPAPAADKVTIEKGLQIIFQRVPSYFDAADTTKQPGFSPLFHRRLSLGAAADYCISNGLTTKLATLQKQMAEMDAKMIAHYSKRSNESQPRMTLRNEDYGGSALTGGIVSSNKFNV